MARSIVFSTLLLTLSLLAAAAPRKTIGISQSSLDDDWRRAMVRDMRIELSNYDDMDLIVCDADNDTARQVSQIRQLVARKVDVLVVSPIESQALSEAVSQAWRSGIPTIVTDRKVSTEDYDVFIGADNYAIGQSAGHYALNLLSESGCAPKILEIWGLKGSSPAQERHGGFAQVLQQAGVRPQWTSVYGDWKPEVALQALASIPPDTRFDLIYCHNDRMAIAAYDHFVTKGGQHRRQVHIIGVDAVAGAGVEAVADGRIGISFLYPTGGAEVVRAARRLLSGEKLPQNIKLASTPVNCETARTLLLQSAHMEDYRRNIETKKVRLDRLNGDFHTLTILFSLVAILCLALAVALVFIQRSRHKLALLNREIRQISDLKLQFYVRLAHEIRKPVNQILEPLEEMRLKDADNPRLEAMWRGARRLMEELDQMTELPERPRLPSPGTAPVPMPRNDLSKQLLSGRYPYRILVVDEDEELRRWTVEHLAVRFEVSEVPSSMDALQFLEKNEADIVLSAVMMKGMNGFELCDKIKGDIRLSHIPVILLTVLSADEYKLYGTSAGADLYITKPYSVDYLHVSIIRLMASRLSLRRSLLEKAEQTDGARSWSAESLDEAFLRKFIALIGRAYADPEYNIERLSSELAMSRGHLYRKVSDLTGMSPIEYLGNFRLRKAMELLETSSLSINQVAYETGFSSPAYFTKRFREKYGRTPTEVRQS